MRFVCAIRLFYYFFGLVHVRLAIKEPKLKKKKKKNKPVNPKKLKKKKLERDLEGNIKVDSSFFFFKF